MCDEAELIEIQYEVQHENGYDLAQFIDIIQQHSCLYNTALPEYKNLVSKHEAWNEVAQAVNMSVEDCQKTWKSLRDRYVREKNKTGSGKNAPASNWELFDKMTFYNQYARRRRIFSTKTTISAKQEPEVYRQDPASSVSALLSPKTSDEDCSRFQVGPNEASSAKRRKTDDKATDSQIEELIKTAKDICSSVTNPVQKSTTNETFGTYIASRLNDMSQVAAKGMRKRILQVLEDL